MHSSVKRPHLALHPHPCSAKWAIETESFQNTAQFSCPRTCSLCFLFLERLSWHPHCKAQLNCNLYEETSSFPPSNPLSTSLYSSSHILCQMRQMVIYLLSFVPTSSFIPNIHDPFLFPCAGPVSGSLTTAEITSGQTDKEGSKCDQCSLPSLLNSTVIRVSLQSR